VREPVSKNRWWEVLSSYSAGQKCYDPWANEWDCCDEFERGATLDDDLEDVITFHGAKNDLLPVVYASPPSLPSLYPHNTLDHEDSIPKLAGVHTSQAIEILAKHYGFVPPLPLPSSPVSDVDELTQKRFKHLVGLISMEEDFFTTCAAGLAMAFAYELVAGKHPHVEKWDLEDRNRVSIVSAQRLKSLRCIHNDLFTFDFEHTLALGWQLAVTSAADALHVCWLASGLDQYGIVRCLLQQGVCFRTLSYIPHGLTSPTPSRLGLLPIQSPGYKFTRKDYDAYQRQCSVIFGQPRARAALLRGGIVWRLAVEILSWDKVLHGPFLDVKSQ
jgi:hypothetical protein